MPFTRPTPLPALIMRTRLLPVSFWLLLGSLASAQDLSRSFPIDQNFVNLPIQDSQERQRMVVRIDADTLTYADVRLADGAPDYWTFIDLSAWQGRRLTLDFERPTRGLDQIALSDAFFGADSLYREVNRPQFHFTSRRGWNNDPNGLVFQNGEYHLFYQHNPFERNWGNMHWGHAVSPDLVHWRELPDALMPDRLGTMFSGSAVIDHDNTAGWGAGALVAAYTADRPGHETQNMAYSLDGGRSFTKYAGNPVIDSRDRWWDANQRDPKVFWYRPGGHWVMALFESNGISIYTSPDLKSWTYQSHVDGFWECPELFELPVDGDSTRTKWVLYGGSGAYMLGSFDGRVFVPEAGKYRTTFGALYAAQTYNDAPQGRRIQIGWGRIEQPDMPFNQMMLFPTELSLRTTREGVRLFSEPVVEVANLVDRSWTRESVGLAEANQLLADTSSELLHVRARVEIPKGIWFQVTWRGNRILSFNGNEDEVNGIPFVKQRPDAFLFDVELLLDRTSVEIFLDEGRTVWASALEPAVRDEGLVFRAPNDALNLHRLEVNALRSIWHRK